MRYTYIPAYRPLAHQRLAMVFFAFAGMAAPRSKSSYTGLRGQDTVFYSFRALVSSYFHCYHNKRGTKTLEVYSVPLDPFLAPGCARQDEEKEDKYPLVFGNCMAPGTI